MSDEPAAYRVELEMESGESVHNVTFDHPDEVFDHVDYRNVTELYALEEAENTVGGTGVEETHAHYESHVYIAAEEATRKAIENYPGDPEGELRVTVTITEQ